MINRIYLSPTDDLKTEYYSVFQGKDDKMSFKFLRKYLKFIESDDECYHRFFLIGDPLKNKDEGIEFMKEFNGTVERYLDDLIRNGKSSERKGFDEGEVTCYLGIAHEYGLFNKSDNLGLAFYYYTIAAQLNNGLGTFRLAQCYEQGLGTPINLAKSVYFYRCAAKLGLVEGMHAYGTILLNGYLGVKKDLELGIHFLSLSSLKATKLYPYSLFDIGQWYENTSKDVNVSSDVNYAYEMYHKGAALRDSNCMYRLAQAFEIGDLGRAPSPSKAFEFYKMAAKRGQVDAQICVSEIYFSGHGNRGNRSPKQSYHWALKAATKSSGRAAYIVGEYALKGFGVKENMLLALWWFGISSSFGYEEAVVKMIELKQEVERKDGGPFIQAPCCNLFC